jgi:hypothetical protein
MRMFASATVLGKYEITYAQCSCCGFVRTEEPYWLDEAYTNAITASDVGLVQRNFQLAAIARVIIAIFFERRGSFVDYAGGYGLLVRLMRDHGIDFRWHDKYCNNIFAQGFVAHEPGREPVTLLTCFEVFEHLADPWGELERMLAYSRNILFTTQLLPPSAPLPGQWWYYGLEHGQHISFYTREALSRLAQRAGLNYYTNGASLHLFTEKRISQPLFYCVGRYRTARLLAPFAGGKSLIPADFTAGTRFVPGAVNSGLKSNSDPLQRRDTLA